MKLLFLTQVLDAQDAVLGFVPRWIQGLARHCERVRVVALEVGDVRGLPPNVDVREIGRRGVVLRYVRYRRVLAEAFGRDGFDTVLSHMVPRYALVADGPARRAGARAFLWYTHKGVDARLIKACARVEKVFTASAESMRVDTPRKVVTGHGIDLEHFRPAPPPSGPPRLLSVGRVTPAKDPLTIVEALARLRAEGRDVALDLVGAGLAGGDAAYGERVSRRIDELGLAAHVARPGEVPYPRVPDSYARATLVVNASHTGSLDKVVLEAFACARPVVSCNESIPPLLAPLGARAPWLHFDKGDAASLARAIGRLLDLPAAERDALGRTLRSEVAAHHEVDALMARLCREMAT
ncbi:MAG: glycosyltransferase [Planctomycetota bacterium]|nr:MAG: glycosyltransferase [Planctomycetota bacterium]